MISRPITEVRPMWPRASGLRTTSALHKVYDLLEDLEDSEDILIELEFADFGPKRWRDDDFRA